MWTGLVLTLFLLAGACALNQNEWRAVLTESYANWTIQANLPEPNGFWLLLSEDFLSLGRGFPIMNYPEYQQFLDEIGFFPDPIYAGLVDLVYADEMMAVATHIGVVQRRNGVFHIGKGVRLFKIESGQVKLWMEIHNMDS